MKRHHQHNPNGFKKMQQHLPLASRIGEPIPTFLNNIYDTLFYKEISNYPNVSEAYRTKIIAAKPLDTKLYFTNIFQ
jgi:hypothetical protein